MRMLVKVGNRKIKPVGEPFITDNLLNTLSNLCHAVVIEEAADDSDNEDST